AGILTCRPSTTPFGLALGPDSPWADLPSPGNLRLSANGILTRFIVTRSGMITRTSSRVRCPYPFALWCDALLPSGGISDWRLQILDLKDNCLSVCNLQSEIPTN